MASTESIIVLQLNSSRKAVLIQEHFCSKERFQQHSRARSPGLPIWGRQTSDDTLIDAAVLAGCLGRRWLHVPSAAQTAAIETVSIDQGTTKAGGKQTGSGDASLSWPGRSKLCGDISEGCVGEEVTLCGWVHRQRDMGGLSFSDIRDHTGIFQARSPTIVSPEGVSFTPE